MLLATRGYRPSRSVFDLFHHLQRPQEHTLRRPDAETLGPAHPSRPRMASIIIIPHSSKATFTELVPPSGWQCRQSDQTQSPRSRSCERCCCACPGNPPAKLDSTRKGAGGSGLLRYSADAANQEIGNAAAAGGCTKTKSENGTADSCALSFGASGGPNDTASTGAYAPANIK